MDLARSFLSLALFLCLLPTTSSKLILLLLDGFRWDYFDLEGLQLKGFPRMFREGVKAEYMVPSYPTNSYPNYYTLMTGLYVESHGIVDNYMWDEDTGDTFELGANPEALQSHWYEFAEPLWVTSTKQGQESYMYHWRECNISIHDTRPAFCLPYRGMPKRQEIHFAMEQGVKKIKEGAESVYIYHENVDNDGHWYGPGSDEVKQSIQNIDADIDMLLDIIDEHDLEDEVNLLVFSDHGMTALDKSNRIDLSTVLDSEHIRTVAGSFSQLFIWPHDGLEKQVYKELLAVGAEHLRVYYRGDIQNRWFFKQHKRIAPIYVTTSPGWYLMHPNTNEYLLKNNKKSVYAGNHGFDNEVEDMRSIFVAKGPSFKKNFVAKGFPNVDMYQIMCRILNIKPRPNNGTWNDVKDMLLTPDVHIEL